MPEKRKDSKGRNLRDGELQRNDGRYEYRYFDQNGQKHSVYSWQLVDTDKIPAGKRCKEINWAVASAYSLPVADKSCDIITSFFAPFAYSLYI